jgi:hypothetical protein
MMGDDGLAPRGEWWVGVMGRVVSFGELCPAQPANLRRWGSIPSLAASKTLWEQSMLVLRWCGIARLGVRAEIMFGGRFANARIRGRASEGRVNQHAGATCLMRFAVRRSAR